MKLEQSWNNFECEIEFTVCIKKYKSSVAQQSGIWQGSNHEKIQQSVTGAGAKKKKKEKWCIIVEDSLPQSICIFLWFAFRQSVTADRPFGDVRPKKGKGKWEEGSPWWSSFLKRLRWMDRTLRFIQFSNRCDSSDCFPHFYIF